jgi:hypothetical protein
MALTDSVARYYSAMADQYESIAGHTDPVVEELRKPADTVE